MKDNYKRIQDDDIEFLIDLLLDTNYSINMNNYSECKDNFDYNNFHYLIFNISTIGLPYFKIILLLFICEVSKDSITKGRLPTFVIN